MSPAEKDLLLSLLDRVVKSEQSDPVPKPLSPDRYRAVLDLDLRNDGVDIAQLKVIVEQLIDETPKTSSTRFFNQLFGGREEIATVGEMLAVMLNTSMYTYKVAGPMVLIEHVITEEIIKRVGYGDKAHGTMSAGGSMTNLKAMIMARDRRDSQASEQGSQLNLVGYTSDCSHYSITKNAALCGVGRQRIRRIATDERGKMSMEALAKQIAHDKAAGMHPFFINATAGTTVLGAFDPISEIADLLEGYPEIWLHVDGAYCGSMIWSEQHRHLVSGIDRSDSFSVNPHKMLSTPLSTSFIVVKDRQHLYDSFDEPASYLYQTADDHLNPGKISMQCGRRNDALKFWMLYKEKGHRGIERMVDHQMSLAQQCRDYLSANPDYTLYPCHESVAVCFNYRDIPPKTLCNDLNQDGELMVGYGSFREEYFIRLVIVNADNTWDELKTFFDRLEAYVEKKYIENEV